MLQKVEGIIIRTTNYGETNKIITLFTRELGKVGVMARGARKPSSRLASVSQIFTYGYFLIQTGSGLGTLQQGESLSSMKHIKEDIISTAYASYLVELTDKAVEDRKVNPYLFELLYQSLNYLNEGLDTEIITMIYEIKMLQVIGLYPHLTSCVSCGVTEGRFSFSIGQGGLLCHDCKNNDTHRIDISPATVRLLRLFHSFDLNRLGNISVKDETKKELKTVISRFYDEYSGLMLKSKRFLNQLDSFQTP
ncbi:DNA repair protein RecO [Bacillus suaedaesalsae]|uniref:DNA repair protein RecO n=1 Tax=Bacillus suaedaesalsae TaxID=2810349 RepID=A0ABS2DL91_9BACI|nr:DNA repair protein RecO [Bacillus suaedaesalsae]MBM6619265.1 DNA repair protein RecO [Bacillus suaedaesalsae]